MNKNTVIAVAFSTALTALAGYYLYSTGFHPTVSPTTQQINNGLNININTNVNSQTNTNSTGTVNNSNIKNLKLSIGEAIHIKDESGENIQGYRPEVEVIGNNIFLVYNNDGQIKYLVLDKDLNPLSSPEKLFPEILGQPLPNMVTDIRTLIAEGKLFYAYEKTEKMGITSDCNSNSLNAALYGISGNELNLLFSKTKITFGCPLPMAIINFKIPIEQLKNKEATDDPVPFYFEGKYYILTRLNVGNYANIRTLNSQMNLVSEKKLDLGSILGTEFSLEQNSLIRINNQDYLIGGIANGPPNGAAQSKIYLIPLADDLSYISGSPQVLIDRPGEFSDSPKSSRLVSNILFVSYQILNADKHGVYVEVFDTSQNFKSLGRILIEKEQIGDNHTPIVIVGSQIFVFYEYSDHLIIVKKISLQ